MIRNIDSYIGLIRYTPFSFHSQKFIYEEANIKAYYAPFFFRFININIYNVIWRVDHGSDNLKNIFGGSICTLKITSCPSFAIHNCTNSLVL